VGGAKSRFFLIIEEDKSSKAILDESLLSTRYTFKRTQSLSNAYL